MCGVIILFFKWMSNFLPPLTKSFFPADRKSVHVSILGEFCDDAVVVTLWTTALGVFKRVS